MPDVKAIFCGCVRDVAAHLDGVLLNIDRFTSLFQKSAFLFIENDSTDDSLNRLKNWSSAYPNSNIISHSGLDLIRSSRTQRLAFCRNLLLHEIKKSRYQEFDVVVMLDMDDVNSVPIDLVGFSDALSFLITTESAAAVCAYQENYYDLWALRHREHFAIDIWEECLRESLATSKSDQEIFSGLRMRYPMSFLSPNTPTKVLSAFGGLALYKRSALVTNPCVYSGEKDFFAASLTSQGQPELKFGKIQQCEHVPFHYGFKTQGKDMFVMPTLGNQRTSGQLNPSFFRTIVIS
jgi:hypothetical protein